MQNRLSDRRVVANITGNAQNTHNAVLSSSIGKVLLNLRATYLGKADDNKVAKFEADAINEIMDLKLSYPAYNNEIDFIVAKIEEPFHPILDLVYVAQRLNNGNLDKVPYLIPLKEVLSLVWSAIKDHAQYQNKEGYQGNEEERLEQATADYPNRLESFFNCLSRMKADGICHYGNRNDLVFLLNGTYGKVHILEDADAAVLAFLRDILIAVFLKLWERELESATTQSDTQTTCSTTDTTQTTTTTSGYSQTKEQLRKALLTWMEESNATELFMLIKQIAPQTELKEELFKLFLDHGCDPQDYKLEERMHEALLSLNFACDPKTHPALHEAGDIIKEMPSQNKALQAIQDWIKHDYQLEEKNERISHFHRYYFVGKGLIRYRELLILAGVMTEQELNELAERLMTPTVQLVEDIEDIKSKIESVKRDTMSHVIENYFANWKIAREKEKQRLYALLLDETFNKKIKLTDSMIQDFQASADVSGELTITPYMINRVFLHAILVSPSDWTNRFADLLKKVYEFVANKFNQGNLAATAQLLRRDSYSAILMDQICFLYNHRQGASADQNPRPNNMILLPEQARTKNEWVEVLSLLDEEQVKNVVQVRLALIQNAFREGDTKGCLSNLPRANWREFVKFCGYRIKNFLKNGNQLAECLRFKSEEKNRAFIQPLIPYLKDIFKDGAQLVMCLWYFDKNTSLELLNIIGGEYLKEIFKNGNELAECLRSVGKINAMTLIALLGDSIKDIVKTRAQLTNCLRYIPEENWVTFIQTLGDNLKDIVDKDEDDDFAKCLQMFGKRNAMVLLKLLSKHLKNIIKNGSQLNVCLGLAASRDDFNINNTALLFRPASLFSEDECMAVIQLLGTNIKDFFKNGDELAECLRLVGKKNAMALIALLGANIKDIIKTGAQLGKCLCCIPDENWVIFIQSLGNSRKGILKDGKELIACLEYFPKVDLSQLSVPNPLEYMTKAEKLIMEHQYSGKNFKDTINSLSQWMVCFKEPQRWALVHLLLDDLKDIIGNYYELRKCLKRFDYSSARMAFIQLLGDDGIKGIIKNGGVSDFLSWLPKDKQLTFAKLLCDCIKDGNELSSCLNFFSTVDRVSLVQLVGNKLKDLIKDGAQLGACLKSVTKEKWAIFKVLLGEPIKAILKDGNELANCLQNLDQKDRMAFIQMFGDRINDLVKSGNLTLNLHDFDAKDQIFLIERYGCYLSRVEVSAEWVATLPRDTQQRITKLTALSKQADVNNIEPHQAGAYQFIQECFSQYSSAHVKNPILASAFRFFTGKWNHNHCDVVSELLAKYKTLDATNAKTFFQDLHQNIDTYSINKAGDFHAIVVMAKTLIGIDFYAMSSSVLKGKEVLTNIERANLSQAKIYSRP